MLVPMKRALFLRAFYGVTERKTLSLKRGHREAVKSRVNTVHFALRGLFGLDSASNTEPGFFVGFG